MGWKLARTAHHLGLGDVLSPSARVVLSSMCWNALDSEGRSGPPGEYWGGHQLLEGDLCGLEAIGTPKAKKAVQRAMRELTEAGLIELLAPAAHNRTARYGLLLDDWKRLSTPVDNSTKGACGNVENSRPESCEGSS